MDWISAVPLAITATLLLAVPEVRGQLARGGWGAHLLDLEAFVRLRERSLLTSIRHAPRSGASSTP